jgi:hypothetical protein
MMRRACASAVTSSIQNASAPIRMSMVNTRIAPSTRLTANTAQRPGPAGMFIESRKIHHSTPIIGTSANSLRNFSDRLFATKPSSNDAGRTIQLESLPSLMSFARKPVSQDDVAMVTKLSSTKYVVT